MDSIFFFFKLALSVQYMMMWSMFVRVYALFEAPNLS